MPKPNTNDVWTVRLEIAEFVSLEEARELQEKLIEAFAELPDLAGLQTISWILDRRDRVIEVKGPV